MSFPRNFSALFSCERAPQPARFASERAPQPARFGGGSDAGAVLGAVALLAACSGQKGADTPGIELGAPHTTWAAKTIEQRFGFMAAQVHPVMTKLFTDYDPDKVGFDCSNCHGSNMEQIDYEMPNKALYALPKARPYDDAIDFDAKIAVFMMTKVTPTLQELFNKGEGPPTKASCFSCHPVAE
jgi:hypothetical protein